MDVIVGLWRRLSTKELMLLNCGVGEDSWGSLGLQGDPTSPFWRRSTLVFLWKKWCWSWNSSTLATSCEELTHWKRLWCWEGLGAGGEGDDRGWDGWMASPTRWKCVWVNSGSGDGQGGLACCNSWGRKKSDTTEWVNWTELRVIQWLVSSNDADYWYVLKIKPSGCGVMWREDSRITLGFLGWGGERMQTFLHLDESDCGWNRIWRNKQGFISCLKLVL